MKKLIAATAFLFIALAGLSQKRYYTSTDYGWREQRRVIVSALGIPTGNGTPTVTNSVDSSQAFVYFDSTNAKFYLYNPKAKTWGELSGGAVDVSGKLNRADSSAGGFYPYATNPKKYIDSAANELNTLEKVLMRGSSATADLLLHRPRGVIDMTGNSTGLTISLLDTTTGASAEMYSSSTSTGMRVHAATATEIGVIAGAERGEIYMGAPDDELVARLRSDTDRVSLSQTGSYFVGGGSLKVQFPTRQTIGSGDFVQDLQAKSGTIALTKDIHDSIAGLQYTDIVIGGNLGDSTAGMPNDSTLVFKNFVAGPGLKRYALSDSTFGAEFDSAYVETKLDNRRKLDSLAATKQATLVSGATIKTINGSSILGSGNITITGGGSQTPWTSHISASNYGVDSVSRYTGYRRTGSSSITPSYFDPANHDAVWALSGSNLTATSSGGSFGVAKALDGKSSGTWSVTFTVTTGGNLCIGLASASTPLSGILGTEADTYCYKSDGTKRTGGSDVGYGASYTSGDIIVMTYTEGVLSFSKNGTPQGTAFTVSAGTYYPAISSFFSATAITADFTNWGASGGGYTYTPTVLFDSTGRILLNAVGDSSLSLKTNSIDRLTINKDGGWLIGGSAGTTGQVLQSNGSAAAPTWVSLPTSAATLTTPRNISDVPFDGSADISVAENEKAVTFKTEFLSAATTASPPFVFAAISTGTAAANATNSAANHSSVMRLTSSTTANGGYRINTDATAIQVGGGEEYVCIFAPVNFTTTTFRAGFFDATTVTAPVDGIWFEYATSGVLTLKTSSNNTSSTSSTLATLSLNTWYKVKFVVNSNATSVTGYLYDAAGAAVANATLTTNIPTTSARVVGCGVICTESTTTATAMVDLDYMHIKLKYAR